MTTKSDQRTSFLKDVLITATEGGTGHWASVSSYRPDEGTATYWEINEDEWDFNIEHEINLDVIATGIQRIVNGEIDISRQGRDNITRDSRENEMNRMDADDADCVVQAALFGELKYG